MLNEVAGYYWVMRSYGQYCALAKALDVVGDRWTLLIVRELLVRGGCRYTDLQYGLPGIATDLLAARLRELERSGVIRREAAPPPVATTLFHLTDRGRQLEAAMQALGRWGGPLLVDAPEDDVFRSHWLALPAQYSLLDSNPSLPPIAIEVRTGDQAMLLETVDGTVRARAGTTEHPDAVMSGPPKLVVGVLLGAIDLSDAVERGLVYEGDPAALTRLQRQPTAMA